MLQAGAMRGASLRLTAQQAAPQRCSPTCSSQRAALQPPAATSACCRPGGTQLAGAERMRNARFSRHALLRHPGRWQPQARTMFDALWSCRWLSIVIFNLLIYGVYMLVAAHDA